MFRMFFAIWGNIVPKTKSNNLTHTTLLNLQQNYLSPSFAPTCIKTLSKFLPKQPKVPPSRRALRRGKGHPQ